MSDQYVGEIRMFGGNFAPVGWVPCNGALLSISNYQMLFALLGTTYGGDGVTTFGVPDLRGRAPVHQATAYPLGMKGGVEDVTLLSSQMPAHTHLPNASNINATSSSPANAFWASNSDFLAYSTAAPDTQLNPSQIAASGGSLPHDNMMPFVTINFIIATEGMYPTQN